MPPKVFEVQANNDLTFGPETITIQVGDTVRWTNVGVAGNWHTITFEDPSIPSVKLPDFFKEEETHTVTFTRAGRFDYVCEIHPPDMVGTIRVQP